MYVWLGVVRTDCLQLYAEEEGRHTLDVGQQEKRISRKKSKSQVSGPTCCDPVAGC